MRMYYCEGEGVNGRQLTTTAADREQQGRWRQESTAGNNDRLAVGMTANSGVVSNREAGLAVVSEDADGNAKPATAHSHSQHPPEGEMDKPKDRRSSPFPKNVGQPSRSVTL